MKFLFSIVLAFFLSANVLAADDIKLTLCANSTNSLTISDIVNCNDLLTNHQNWTVKSFTVSFEVNGTEYSYDVVGSNFNAQIHQAIQNLNPTKIIIDKVVLIGINNYERGMEGIEITVIP